ncbi:MAG: T9SS type A sorting domain-containing protein, partial [Aliifodinibius sp.]|nr:T9SS type A sorting domain-containing protein [Fodinibius sp.]NIV09767.1 T9SS type A sorting domain-containing protein [Fodinibius sp.]NIY25353.1 T9SS type A sorting domain-containing protein [Fodinibius sp.]
TVHLEIANLKNIPSTWDVRLVNRETGHEITPSVGANYRFKTSGEKDTKGKSAQPLQQEYHLLSEADPSKAQFVLQIDPGARGTGLPKEIDLKQNYPNPFNPTTTIRFTLPIQNEVTLEVFNILGRKVATLINDESYQAGLHSINWNATDFASGTYIYRLQTGEKVVTKKMTLIK